MPGAIPVFWRPHRGVGLKIPMGNANGDVAGLWPAANCNNKTSFPAGFGSLVCSGCTSVLNG